MKFSRTKPIYVQCPNCKLQYPGRITAVRVEPSSREGAMVAHLHFEANCGCEWDLSFFCDNEGSTYLILD